MIQAVIFDCDGMVVDSDRVSDRVMKEFGTPIDTINSFFGSAFQRCVIGHADLRDELLSVLNYWKWPGTVDDLLAYWFDPVHNRIRPEMREVAEFLHSRKGIKTYLATNNEKYRTHNLFVERGLREWFNDVFSSGLIGHKKPEPEFFQYIVSHVDEPKENILFCDDDEDNIAGAEAFGLQTFFYTSFDEFKQKVSTI